MQHEMTPTSTSACGWTKRPAPAPLSPPCMRDYRLAFASTGRSIMPFIPDTVVLVQFAIASVILAITPGPDMTLFVSRTLSQGRRAGFASMAGALTGTLVHTTLVVVGVSALIVASPASFL